MTDHPLCVLEHGSDRDGNPRHAEAVTGLLCRRHRQQLDDHATEISNLILDTMRVRDGGAPREQSPKTRHLKAAEAPAPGDLAIMALYDSRTKTQRLPGSKANPAGDQSEPMIPAAHVVASWLLLVADERPLEETRRHVLIRRNRAVAVTTYVAPMTLPDSLLAQIDLLVRHHDWLAGQSFVDDYVTELAELRKALRLAVNDRAHWKVGACDLPITEDAPCVCACHSNRAATCSVDLGHGDRQPYCGPHQRVTRTCGGTLLAENGTGIVRCTACHAQWATAQELARLAVRL